MLLLAKSLFLGKRGWIICHLELYSILLDVLIRCSNLETCHGICHNDYGLNMFVSGYIVSRVMMNYLIRVYSLFY